MFKERSCAVGSPEHLGMSRRTFVKLGLSTATLMSLQCATPFMAKAKTVRFNAATTGKLSRYCRGNGSDESARIQKCFDDHLYVEVDEPVGEVAYGVGVKRGIGIRSGQEVDGTGFGKFVRAGKYLGEQACLRNSDFRGGNRGIKINNISLEGRRQRDPTVPNIDSQCKATGIVFRVFDDGPAEKLRDISMTNVQVRNWPGMGIRVINGKHIKYAGVKNINSARDGIRFTANCYDLTLTRCQSVQTGDTAFGFWATGFVYGQSNVGIPEGDMHDITLTDCRSYTRSGARYGAALMIYGARNLTARGCTFGPAKNDVIHISSDNWASRLYVPKDILIEKCRVLGGRLNSLEVSADQAARVVARYNYMYKPARRCVHVKSMTGGRHTLDVTITKNTLVKPGRQHILVEDNISGVKAGGNKLS